MDKLRKRIAAKLNGNHSLLGHFLVVLGLSIISNLFVALYYFYMGRKLGPEAYGELLSLYSIFFTINILSNVILFILTWYISFFKAKCQEEKIGALLRLSTKGLFILGFLIFLFIAASTKTIAFFLKLNSSMLVILIGLLAWAQIFVSNFYSIFAGLQKFKTLGLFRILNSFFPLILGIIFVELGMGVLGAILAEVIGTILVIPLAIKPLRYIFKLKPVKIGKTEIYSYLAPIFVYSLCFGFFINIDVFFVKYYFSATTAGFYAAASLISKLIFFISISLMTVSFPKVCELNSNGEDTSSLLKGSLKYTIYLTFGIVSLFILFPKVISGLFYGTGYKIQGILGPLGFAMALLSMTNVLVLHNLALKKFKTIYYLLGFVFLEVVLINIFHSKLNHIIIIVNLVMFLMLLFTAYQFKEELIYLYRKKKLKDVPLDFYLRMRHNQL